MKKLFASILLCSSLFTSTAKAAVTYEEFLEVKNALYQAFEELKPGDNHLLSINTLVKGLWETYWWELNIGNASYVRAVEENGDISHNVFLIGGFARAEGMTPDGLALTGCHEIGHGIGGGPKKDPYMAAVESSVEGQSDYYATATCLEVVLKYLKPMRELGSDPYYELVCEAQSARSKDICMRMFTALESDIALFASTGDQTSVEDFSTVEMEEINFRPSYYPDAQCRIDTMIHGILKLERPKCWFPNGEENGAFRDQL